MHLNKKSLIDSNAVSMIPKFRTIGRRMDESVRGANAFNPATFKVNDEMTSFINELVQEPSCVPVVVKVQIQDALIRIPGNDLKVYR